jgi:hypothetical protein
LAGHHLRRFAGAGMPSLWRSERTALRDRPILTAICTFGADPRSARSRLVHGGRSFPACWGNRTKFSRIAASRLARSSARVQRLSLLEAAPFAESIRRRRADPSGSHLPTPNARRQRHTWCTLTPNQSVNHEQGRQRVGHGRRGGVGQRQPEELPAAGQVADGQQVIGDPVDRCRRLRQVDRPDGAGRGPVQHVQGPTMALTPDPAVAGQQIVELGAAHVREGLVQVTKPDTGPVQVEVMNHAVALCAPGAGRRPAGQWSGGLPMVIVVPPLSQRPAGDAEPASGFPLRVAGADDLPATVTACCRT